jgi:hypothetical protein
MSWRQVCNWSGDMHHSLLLWLSGVQLKQIVQIEIKKKEEEPQADAGRLLPIIQRPPPIHGTPVS